MTDLTQATLIIYRSAHGRGDWSPILPTEVPEWLKVPDVMGRLVAGEVCMKCDEGDKGSEWYMAEQVTA